MPRVLLPRPSIRMLLYGLAGVVCGFGLYRWQALGTGPDAFRTARALYKQGDVEGAIRTLEQLMKDPRWGAEALYWIGRMHWEQAAWSRAERAWREVLQRQPDHAEAIWGLLDLYEAELRTEEAERLVVEVWSRERDLANRQILLVRLLVQHSEEPSPEQLLVQLSRVVYREPDNAEALCALAASEANLGRPNRALTLLGRAVEVATGTDKFVLRLQRARILADAGELARAEEELERADELLAGHEASLPPYLMARFWWLRGRCAEARGDTADAARAYREAVRYAPGEYRYRFSYARLLQATGETAAAEREFSQARRLREARENLVRLFRKMYSRGGPTAELCEQVAEAYRQWHKPELATLWSQLGHLLRSTAQR